MRVEFLQRGGVAVEYGEEVVPKADVEKWGWVSLFNLPTDERRAVYRWLDANYEEECVEKPKAQKKAHAAASLERKGKAVADEEARQLKKAAQQALCLSYKRAASAKQLRRMLREASKSESAQFAVLARQIGIRKHVNQVQKPVGKGYSSMKAQQLQPLVEAMVQQEKYTKPQLVKVPALKPREQTPFADAYATQLDKAREARAEEKAKQLDAMIADGSFMALLKRKPSSKKKAGTTATTAKRTAAPRKPTAAQAAELNGATFEGDGIKWEVLKVEWSEEYESILVYYYDVSAVAAASKSEAELDDGDDDVEASSIKEVLEWIKKSS